MKLVQRMIFSRIILRNWKNFRDVDVPLPDRAFLIGPNASGKSNFLDAFRFLRDLSNPGGLQQAVSDRGGIPKIRCLHARSPSDIEIAVELVDNSEIWKYTLVFTQQGRYPRQEAAVVVREKVERNNELLLDRPDQADTDDGRLLEQTALEQLSRNGSFRSVVDHFRQITYLHLVPQVIRGNKGVSQDMGLPDVYGGRFLELVAKTTPARRDRILKRIESFLRQVVPQLTELKLSIDKRGSPHLEARYTHWRPEAETQDETQFSDGTLRLIGLLWVLQDGSGVLLMEEPELSLHQAIVQQLAPFIHQALSRSKTPRQAFISTHSVDLLSDPGIAAEEIVLFSPGKNGTEIKIGAQLTNVRSAMAEGLTAAEVLLPKTHMSGQMMLFDEL